MLVDLKAKPYFLCEEQISWVEETLGGMSPEEKLKQLFFILTASKDEAYLTAAAHECQFGGARYNPDTAQNVLRHNRILQRESKIPCLIAANTEAGGNGACYEGTEIGVGTKVASTGDLHLAYEMGSVSAKEARAVGVNTLFAPIVDIHHDFHNPIISYKTFGKDPSLVRDMSLQFLKGVQDVGLIACAKHFPGDGYDERDQHLAPSVNPLSTKEWDQSFGMVYRALIENGLEMVMAGHIQLPSYQRHFAPEVSSYLPASVCRELITDLLKGKLGFNGLVTTDATHMVGLTCSMKRSEFLPRIIAAGCDMILFYNDFEEDLRYMKEGYEAGIITEERLNDAVRRILGIKAKHLRPEALEEEPDLSVIGCQRHLDIAREVAEKGITLVKHAEPGLLPLQKEKHRRILIVPQHDENPFAGMMKAPRPTIYDYIREKFEAEGFVAEIFESLMDKAKRLPPAEAMKLVSNVYNNKTPISDLTENYDVILHFCDFDSHNTVSRISWKMSKGTPDIPWYVNEVPTIMVSLRSPFHLFDAPQIKTYINAYDKNKITIDALIAKLIGKEEFTGVSPVDAFCGDPTCKNLF